MIDASLRVNSVRFNQDNSCFACALNNGFVLFNTNPLKQILRVDLGKPIAWVEPLFRCSIVALVAGEESDSSLDLHKVILFDYFVRKPVVELDVNAIVRNVLLRRDRIIVAVESRLLVYSLTDIPERLFTVETPSNSAGICAVSHSHSDSNDILAFPSKSVGHVGVVSLTQPQSRVRVFQAHNHVIQTIAVSFNGSLIATASAKGTLIRVFDAIRKSLLFEFRRGTNNAAVSCIKFSTDSASICVSSDHRTVHVFKLAPGLRPHNQSFIQRCFKSRTSSIRLYTATKSERNLSTQCSFIADGRSVAGQSSCAFLNSDLVIDLNGSFYKYDVDIERLCCLKCSYKLFVGNDDRNNGV